MRLKKKILVVEDNAINREILCGILSPEYEVLQAENGQEALDVLEVYQENVSLILLDIIMPVMGGYTFLSLIKKDDRYSSIPVIVTTQSDDESDEVTALSHGAADFVPKPYRPKIILHRVANMIHLRETAAMVNLMRHDRLTGLFTREFFYQRAREIILLNPDKKYDIVCSDVVNFKLINDVFGPVTGDALLRVLADYYTDVLGSDGICGRFHADQFVCLVQHREKYTDEMFTRAIEYIRQSFNIKNIALKWGIYSITDSEVAMEQMCDRALLAARSIKEQYGKHFTFYDDELREAILKEQAVTDSMESALLGGEFEIYLQPKYYIADRKLTGAEALIRWNHPEWGLLYPDSFIPLFEKNGFITRLDQFVWDGVGAILQKWKKKGYPQIPISVNISRADIYNADLANILTAIVEKYQIPVSLLHLEITESAYTENPTQIIATVGQLREKGFIIEMDDFGSGYSSLNMLNVMPIDILKLDKGIVQGEDGKLANQGILQFIMSLASFMKLTVVAEGVETEEQLEQLRLLGCDCAQGYLFSKPIPVAEFEEKLSKRQNSRH